MKGIVYIPVTIRLLTVVWHHPEENKCLFTSYRTLLKNQNRDTTKFQPHESMSFMGFLNRNVGNMWLTGAEIIPSQLQHQKSKSGWWWLITAGNLEHTAPLHLWWAAWWAGQYFLFLFLFFLQTIQLVWDSSRQLGCIPYCWARGGSRGSWEKWMEGYCCQNVLYKRIICFQL